MAQRVLVTAGASGIGKEIAKAYVAIGAKVCVCDIDAKALDTSSEKICCGKHHRDVVARRTFWLSEPQRVLHGKDGADRLRQNAVA